MPNYLYNGVELPDVNAYWTDKEKFVSAQIYRFTSDDSYCLVLRSDVPYYYEILGTSIKNIGSRETAEQQRITSYDTAPKVYEVQQLETDNGFSAPLAEIVWTSADIIDMTNGGVYLAASEPVPVPEPEPDEPNPPDTTIMGLITDRTSRNVVRRNELAAKGWARMTDAERGEWVGDPLSTVGVNLLPLGAYYSSTVGLTYKNSEFRATATSGGTYLYAVLIIGDATKYENKQFTLSVDAMIKTAGSPQLALYWHDANGFEYAGATLTKEGSVTVNLSEWPNTNGRASLALYVYVTTAEEVPIGAYTRFVGVMFENGATRHPYVPYAEVVPTLATKGAYNYSDLNRVERAVREISDTRGLGLTTKTDWAMWDIPRKSDMKRYLDNVKTIAFVIGSDIELPDSMDKLTYEMANNIEKVLVEGSKY